MTNCLKCRAIISGKVIYGLHEKCFITCFGEACPDQFHDLDPKKRTSMPSNTEIEKKIDTFYHGNYLKYSAKLGSVSYILKIQEEDYPELPRVEYHCNEIAELLGIDVPPYYLINFNGRLTFVTRNFMQDYVGTLDHIYKFLPAGIHHYNCEEIVKKIIVETRRLADVARFIEICLFDALIGNTDRHGRNLGLITTAHSKKLAPMYDNPTTLGIEPDFMIESHYNPSCSIWTKHSKEPKPLDYLLEFDRLGHKKIALNFCNKVRMSSNKIIDIISKSEIETKRKLAIISLLKCRIEEFSYDK